MSNIIFGIACVVWILSSVCLVVGVVFDLGVAFVLAGQMVMWVSVACMVTIAIKDWLER